MSIAACAALVERGDPDRFRAAMSCPAQAREVLFPLYAFNLEIARAPWVTREAMIAEMRLQWWRDVVSEAGPDSPARDHEVARPLADLIRRVPALKPLLDEMICARRWDIYSDPFSDQAALDRHLSQTAATLAWASALALGADPASEQAVRDRGWASGVAQWLLAVPALEAAGRIPLVDGRPEAVSLLAQRGSEHWSRANADAVCDAAYGLRACWRAPVLLRRAQRVPQRVAQGTLAEPEALQRLSLLWRAVRGR